MEEVNDSGDLQCELDATKDALDAIDREISSLVQKKRSLRKRYEEVRHPKLCLFKLEIFSLFYLYTIDFIRL
ncbi:hypothetical protein PHET_12309 [Paragonimus heterotremus]|uniref:Uncharacterized protein n=1 Tax=Paragonimus heterotremus TaxID=100268 RepID=A0A8J4WLY9_9TREM|nr:hypothetical protein PHET_12309 [Paragonimus heterotremus]